MGLDKEVTAEPPNTSASTTAPNPVWTRKHLLGLEDLTREEIVGVLDTAESFAEISTRNRKKVPALQGRIVEEFSPIRGPRRVLSERHVHAHMSHWREVFAGLYVEHAARLQTHYALSTHTRAKAGNG